MFPSQDNLIQTDDGGRIRRSLRIPVSSVIVERTLRPPYKTTFILFKHRYNDIFQFIHTCSIHYTFNENFFIITRSFR